MFDVPPVSPCEIIRPSALRVRKGVVQIPRPIEGNRPAKLQSGKYIDVARILHHSMDIRLTPLA